MHGVKRPDAHLFHIFYYLCIPSFKRYRRADGVHSGSTDQLSIILVCAQEQVTIFRNLIPRKVDATPTATVPHAVHVKPLTFHFERFLLA